jgi:membrane protein implicated in regulation of membrane protease activity
MRQIHERTFQMQTTSKRQTTKVMLLSAILAFSFTAFSVPAQAFPGNTPQAPQQTPQETSQGAPSGKVVEKLDSAGYTYVCVENGGKKIWAAVPQTQVKVGDQVMIIGAMEMQNFTSKTLNRTFESILFGQGLSPVTAKK